MWADEDDDYLTRRYESGVDSKGIKTVVEYAINASGQKVKTTTKVKVFPEQQRISRTVAERKKWRLFGAAAEVTDNHSYTLTSQEQVMMETPRESKEADEAPSNISDSLKKAMEHVRSRNIMRQAGMLGDGEAAPTDDEPKISSAGAEGNKYVPPGARFSIQAGEEAASVYDTLVDQNTAYGMALKATIARATLASSYTWRLNLNERLLFRDFIQNTQYSLYINGKDFPKHVLRSVKDNTVVVDADSRVSGTVSVLVDQSSDSLVLRSGSEIPVDTGAAGSKTLFF
jgi:hypothetical protein